MYLLSVPWSEAQVSGAFFGEKLILNEFVAYLHFGADRAHAESEGRGDHDLRALRLRQSLFHRDPDGRAREPRSGAARIHRPLRAAGGGCRARCRT